MSNYVVRDVGIIVPPHIPHMTDEEWLASIEGIDFDEGKECWYDGPYRCDVPGCPVHDAPPPETPHVSNFISHRWHWTATDGRIYIVYAFSLEEAYEIAGRFMKTNQPPELKSSGHWSPRDNLIFAAKDGPTVLWDWYSKTSVTMP